MKFEHFNKRLEQVELKNNGHTGRYEKEPIIQKFYVNLCVFSQNLHNKGQITNDSRWTVKGHLSIP